MNSSIGELLAAADAEEYAVHFRREGFRTVREVLDAGLTQRDLDHIGVTNAEARNRIVRALFRSNSAAGEGGRATEDDTLSLWLSELGVKQLCAPRFRAEGFRSLQEVIDARLSEDDLKDLGLETMKARKAALKSLAALTSEATARQGGAGLGAAAEATFIESYHRHRRLSAASLTSAMTDSFQSATSFSNSDSDSDEDVAVSGEDGGLEAQEGLIRAIGVLPAGDLQAPLLAPATQQEGDEDTENRQADVIDQGRFQRNFRFMVVGLFALGISTAFIVLWFASYSFDFEELIQRDVEGYEVGDSLFDLAIVLLFSCTSLLVAASLGCSRRPNGGCMRASTGASAAAVLVLPALTIGSATKLIVLLIRLGDSTEESERIWLRMSALGLSVAFLPVAYVGISWSRLLQIGPTAANQYTLAGQLRLGRGLALVCAALIFTVLGLALGESAMTGAPGVSRPTADRWFTVALPIATWVFTATAVWWLEGLAAVLRPIVWLITSTFDRHVCYRQLSEQFVSLILVRLNSRLMDQAVLLLANPGDSNVRDDPPRRRGARAGRQNEKNAVYAKFGLTLGSETLGSFLGGVKLLEMLLLFLAAHTSSFPRWRSGANELTIGWQWAIGLAGGATGTPAAVLLAGLSCLSVLRATRDPNSFLVSPLARPTIAICRALDNMGPVRALDILVGSFRDCLCASRQDEYDSSEDSR